MGDVDKLAQTIRQVDGNHTMGAGRLAEEIVRSDWLIEERNKAILDYEMNRRVSITIENIEGEPADHFFEKTRRDAHVEILLKAAERLAESTQADVNNYIGRPQPTFSHTERYADVQWLKRWATEIQNGDRND